MAVAIDATGTKQVGGSSVSTTNYSFTVGSSLTNSALLVFLNLGVNISSSGWTASSNLSGSMTVLGSKVTGITGNIASCVVFGLLNPAAGTHTITLNWTGANFPTVCAQSYTGVEQSSIANAFKNVTTGTTSSLAVTSATGDMAICMISSQLSLTALNQTVIFNDTTSSGSDSAASRAAGAASVTFTATGTSGNIATVGLDIAASSATSATLGKTPSRIFQPNQGPSKGIRATQAFPSFSTVLGTLATTEATDVAAFAGGVLVSGPLITTEATDTAAFAGDVKVAGPLITTEATDVAAFNGSVVVSGPLITTEATDVAAFNGSVVVSGPLITTEAADIAAFNGDIVVSGPLITTEAQDIAAFNGSTGSTVSGTLATTEATDTALFNGDIVVSGPLTTTEATDVAAFAGSVVVSGPLIVTEGADTAAFAGAVGTSGSLATTEATDSAAFAGSVLVSGPLITTEATDTSAISGSVLVSGALITTEGADIAAFSGTLSVATSGTLATTEAPDIALFTDQVIGGGGNYDPYGWGRHDKVAEIYKAKQATLPPTVQQAAAHMSSLGGHARAQALTAKQRTVIATKAAVARWK